MSKQRVLDILWGASIVIGLLLCLWGINLPYVGIYNANNNYLALASKNFLRFGYSTLHFLPTYFVGQSLPPIVPYYLHHPVAFFLIASVPFVIFGAANWVVHAATFVFVLGSIAVLYLVVREVGTRDVARWTAAFAILFSLTSFFWKYMFFEQPSMFFSLLVLYLSIRFWKSAHSSYLWWLGIASALGGAIDWYGGYMVFPFLYLIATTPTRRVRITAIVYSIGEALGLGTYVFALVVTGHMGAFWEGLSARGLTSELTSLSYWPIRYVAITILRIIIYSSPIVVLGIADWMRRKERMRTQPLLRRVSVMFLTLGLVNIVFLPSATWGHSYFLFYLVPFFSLACGRWVASWSGRSVAIAVGIMLLQFVWSMGINGLKLTQVTKQLWKYDVGRDVATVIPRYSSIGVMEYPGDVLQNYFSIDAVPMSISEAEQWAQGGSFLGLRYVLVTCKGACVLSEKEFIGRMGSTVGIWELHEPSNTAWLLDKRAALSHIPAISLNSQDQLRENNSASSVIVTWYREIRDFLGSTQL